MTHPSRERVLIGMPLYDGKPEWQTSQSWGLLERDPLLLPGFELITAKFRFFSAGTARNLLICQAKELRCRRVLFIDHDMVFRPEHVARILSHQKPIVGGLCPKKNPRTLQWACRFDPATIDADGLAPAFNVGAAFLSVDMEAVAAIEAANSRRRYVVTHEALMGKIAHHLFAEEVVENNWDNPGKPSWPCLLSEDLHFCHLARTAGIPLFVDTRCQIGHLGIIDFLEMHKQRAQKAP